MSIKDGEKLDLGSVVRDYATQIEILNAAMQTQVGYYFDNGFNAGGSDEIDDSTAITATGQSFPEAVGITAAQLGDWVNFSQQLDAWLNNGVPLQSQWSTIVSKVRRVK